MISEGSWDTDDWSNDAENSALLYKNKLFFSNILQINKLFKNLKKVTILLFLLYFFIK